MYVSKQIKVGDLIRGKFCHTMVGIVLERNKGARSWKYNKYLIYWIDVKERGWYGDEIETNYDIL